MAPAGPARRELVLREVAHEGAEDVEEALHFSGTLDGVTRHTARVTRRAAPGVKSDFESIIGFLHLSHAFEISASLSIEKSLQNTIFAR